MQLGIISHGKISQTLFKGQVQLGGTTKNVTWLFFSKGSTLGTILPY
jgi:hypothetical protein